MANTSLDESKGGHAFLQRRMALYGLHGSNIGWFFLAFRVVEGLFAKETFSQLTHPSMLYHFLGALSLLSIWFLCRGRERSVRFIRMTEIVGTFLACAFYALMGFYIPLLNQPQFIVLLALSFGMFARAIFVPSSTRRTLLVTGLSGLPLLAMTYYLYFNFDVQPWLDIAPWLADTSPSSNALGVTLWTGAWWLCATVICGAASRVIYGLRRQVRDVKKLGQYTLVEKLGEGGMGMVYRAEHAMLRRPTAIKLLPVEKAGARSVARFEKEVQLTAMLTHPNTVTIFDYGRTPDGVFYYAMEYLDGATLSAVVDTGGPLEPARVVHILNQAAGALAEAHGVHLIHRDIKPANIMLVEQGGTPDVAKVLDFGLVKELDQSEDTSLTKADSITGTPQYIAPEAITSPDDVDARSDIYALGAVGYYLLTGTHVFGGNTVIEVCSAHLHEQPVPMSKRTDNAVPPELEALILSCLYKPRDERPQSAAELQRALARCKSIGEWSEEDARAWWATHGGTIETSRDIASATVSGLTVDIDLARRQGAA